MLIFKWPCIVVWFGNLPPPLILPPPFRIINGGGRILNGGGRILNGEVDLVVGLDFQTKPTQTNIFNQEKWILKEEKRIFKQEKRMFEQ